MKNIKYLILTILGLISLASCEDDPEVFVSASPKSSEISAPVDGSNLILSLETASEMYTFTWSHTDFGFQSSNTYTIELTGMGKTQELATVTSPNKQYEVSYSALNEVLLGMGYPAGESTALSISIVASVNSNVPSISSEIVTVNVTPYQTTFPPIYMIGGAVGGWDPTLAVEMRSSEPYVYETVAYYTSGEAYRYFSSAGWDAEDQYNWTYFASGTIDVNLENAEDGDTNIRFIGTSGYYKTVVNTNAKIITMEAVDEPKMFLIGAAIVDAGWNTSTAVKMTWVSNGIFTATTDFTPEAFRFFAQQDWGPTSYNFPYFANGEVSSLFENAGDGDSNFKFIGAAGKYKITLNMLDLIITMDAQ